MMYVAKVKLDSIRGFHDARRVDLDLTRPGPQPYAGWTVLAGPNGAGRSTLLRAVALALAGPVVAPSLIGGGGSHWVSAGKEQGGIELDLRVDSLDGFPRGFEPPEGDVYADMVVSRDGVSAESNAGRNGPWQDDPVGWLSAGYGPFRRLGGGTAPPQPRPLSRLASLFREDMSLSDGVSWLIGLNLRARERRPGAAELRDAVMAVLGDGLFPDGYHIGWLESDGLWAEPEGGARLPVRELGDAYRSVAALVVDLLRNVHGAFRDLPLEAERPVVTAPGVVLIDEVDAHLDPFWQQHVGEWLKRHFPRIQFLVTTGSPYICQSADPAGLIHLPAPQERRPPYQVDGDLFHRVVFGSGEDIVLSGLFGLDNPYSPRARRLRRELADLELKVLDGQAGDVQLARYRELQELLVSSPRTRAREVETLLPKERARRGTT